MSEPYFTPGAITQPKRSGWRVAIIILVIVAVIFALYSYFTASGGSAAKSDVPQATENSTPPSAITATRTPTPTPVEHFDEDTARDLCWGQSLPGVQTSVPSGMSVYDGLGVDKGMRICMTPGEYARYQAAVAKQSAAEEEVRSFVGQYTASDAPKSLRATAAVAYLCALDAPSDMQRSAARVVYGELAGQNADFSATRDAMCGNRSRPTPPPPITPADPKSPVTTDDPGR